MVNEKSITLWLLHGAAFTSKTWQDSIPTIQTICALGYRVVAIDIPGIIYFSIENTLQQLQIKQAMTIINFSYHFVISRIWKHSRLSRLQ